MAGTTHKEGENMEKKIIIWCPVCRKAGKCTKHKVNVIRIIDLEKIAEKMLDKCKTLC
jgi:hypothetical protein